MRTPFERLEDRLTLAGNVLVTGLGTDTILVLGDEQGNLDNDIQVWTSPDENGRAALMIRGLNGTTINGVLSWTVVVPYEVLTTTRLLGISLGAGDDVVDIDGIAGTDLTQLVVNTGIGNDRVAVADVNQPLLDVHFNDAAKLGRTPFGLTDSGGDDLYSIGTRRGPMVVDEIWIEDRFGSNQVYVAGIETGRLFRMDADSDQADRNVVSIGDFVSRGALQLNLGDAADTVLLNRVDVATFAGVALSVGDDTLDVHASTLGFLSVEDGFDSDSVNVYTSQLRDGFWFSVDSSGGTGVTQRFGLYDTDVGGNGDIQSKDPQRSGIDVVAADLLTVTGGNLRIGLGGGDDVVYLKNTTVDAAHSVEFVLGSGHDRLGLNTVDMGGTVNIATGQLYNQAIGNDEYSIGNSRIGALRAVDPWDTNGYYFTDTTFERELSVLGAGSISNLFYTARIRVLGGTTVLLGGSGADSYQLLDDSVFGGEGFQIQSGGGADQVLMNRASVQTTGDVVFDLSDGDDTVTAFGTAFQPGGAFTFKGGLGRNTASGTGNTTTKPAAPTDFETFTLF